MKLKMKVKHYVHCLGFYTHHTHTKKVTSHKYEDQYTGLHIQLSMKLLSLLVMESLCSP